MDDPAVKRPPYTEDEIASFNAYQESNFFHPFTCGVDQCRTNLEANPDGLTCPACCYVQHWGHTWQFDWSWKRAKLRLGDIDAKD